jgi:hypothetical protein
MLSIKVQDPSEPNTGDIAEDALHRVAKAADQIARLEPRLDAARTELHAAIREAYEKGASVMVIARVANLSRQRISQLVK